MTTPGMTSSIELPLGVLTLQTELVGDPPELVTLVDLSGRVVRRIRTPCPPGADLVQLVRRIHGGIDRRLREAIETRRGDAGGDDGQAGAETAALLFLSAIEAFIAGDARSARHMLACVADLLPNDGTVAANLRVLHDRGDP